MSNAKWPDGIQKRTAEEWEALGKDWNNKDSRDAIVAALKALGVPATEYARMQPVERAQRIAAIQEERAPGSTTGKKATATGGSPAGKAAAKPASTAKAAASAGQSASSGGGGGGGSVDFGPVLAKLAEIDAKVDGLAVSTKSVETLLKLILLNPSMTDSLALAGDADVLAEFEGKSIGELASGNG